MKTIAKQDTWCISAADAPNECANSLNIRQVDTCRVCARSSVVIVVIALSHRVVSAVIHCDASTTHLDSSRFETFGRAEKKLRARQVS